MIDQESSKNKAEINTEVNTEMKQEVKSEVTPEHKVPPEIGSKNKVIETKSNGNMLNQIMMPCKLMKQL